MHELKKHEQEFLNELLKHPGWPVLIRIFEHNKNSLIDSLYSCPQDQQDFLIQRWRAMETLYQECKALETSNDVVQLGID